MWLIMKGLGTIFVMSGMFLYGLLKIDTYRQKIDELQAFRKAFVLLSSEISFSYAQLPEAVNNVSLRCDNEKVKGFLNDVRNMLEESPEQKMSISWGKCISKWTSEWNLNKDDIKIIKNVGDCLGHADIKVQLDTLKREINELEESERCASLEMSQNSRLVKTLSVACGAFICIMLM